MANMAQARCIRAGAFMSLLAYRGTEFEPEAVAALQSDIAAVRQEYGASRADIARAIASHLPPIITERL